MLFNFAIEYTIRKGQDNQKGFELNGTHHFLIYAGYINTSGEDINTIKKKTHALLHSNKDGGLEVNAGKTKYMAMCHHQNVGRNL